MKDFLNKLFGKAKKVGAEIADKAEDAFEAAKDKAEDIMEDPKVKATLDKAKAKAADFAEDAKAFGAKVADKAEDAFEVAKDKAEDLWERAKDKAEDLLENKNTEETSTPTVPETKPQDVSDQNTSAPADNKPA